MCPTMGQVDWGHNAQWFGWCREMRMKWGGELRCKNFAVGVRLDGTGRMQLR